MQFKLVKNIQGGDFDGHILPPVGTCESDFAARMHRNSPSERKSHEGTPNYNELWGCDVKTDNITHVAQFSR
jgi:hypothetical protein